METHVSCSCCGKLIGNNSVENVSFGEKPYPHDVGVGACVECFGDRKASLNPGAPAESQVKRRLGWAGRAFYEARFAVLATKLSASNASKFLAMSYAQKVSIVARMIERGVLA